jgi:hypothetical protein
VYVGFILKVIEVEEEIDHGGDCGLGDEKRGEEDVGGGRKRRIEWRDKRKRVRSKGRKEEGGSNGRNEEGGGNERW